MAHAVSGSIGLFHAVVGFTMKPQTVREPATKASMMSLLSDEEIAHVSHAESKPRLSDGDEYLDLMHLEQGVQEVSKANHQPIDMTHIVPKKAVRLETWNKMVARLPTHS